MPRQGNAKKTAAQKWSKIKALDAATTEGKYILARVEKALGFCQFQAKAEMPDGSVRDVTVLVRGKFKGGKNCVTHVEAGCFVLVQGDVSRTLEIVGVVNRQSEVNKLRQGGRLTKKLLGDDHDIDDLFDRSEEDGAAGGAVEKPEELSEELLARYRRRAEAGAKLRDDLLRGKVGTTVSEEADLFSEGDEDTAAPSQRRPRKKKTIQPTEQTSTEEEELAAALNAAQLKAELLEAKQLESLMNRKVHKSWEDDEIDIDAI
jgi:hypothetical protein